MLGGPIGGAIGAVVGTVAGVYIGEKIWDTWFADEDSGDEDSCECDVNSNDNKVPTSPPEGLVENPNRPGSWGEYDKNGKFKERWRLDKGRPEVKKGHGSKDHVHIDGGKKPYPIGD